MERRTGHVVRKGQVYRFTEDGTDYAIFVWAAGRRFCGRIEDHPQIPELHGDTSLGVRDALISLLHKTRKQDSQ